MTDEINTTLEQIEKLSEGKRTNVFLYSFIGGEVSSGVRVDALKALAAHVRRVEKMREHLTLAANCGRTGLQYAQPMLAHIWRNHIATFDDEGKRHLSDALAQVERSQKDLTDALSAFEAMEG